MLYKDIIRQFLKFKIGTLNILICLCLHFINTFKEETKNIMMCLPRNDSPLRGWGLYSLHCERLPTTSLSIGEYSAIVAFRHTLIMTTWYNMSLSPTSVTGDTIR